MTVLPLLYLSCMSFSFSVSKTAVASSSSKTGASIIVALAMQTHCFWPPDGLVALFAVTDAAITSPYRRDAELNITLCEHYEDCRHLRHDVPQIDAGEEDLALADGRDPK
jgi:hypothetical protein